MTQQFNKIQKIQDNENKNSGELQEILTILDAIENHTAELRKKIISEISVEKNNLHLKLNKIDEE
jgi:hypothetical protein